MSMDKGQDEGKLLIGLKVGLLFESREIGGV